MRWDMGPKKERRNGDTRTIRRFALIPVCINREWRWLEWVVLDQEYDSSAADRIPRWHNIRFVDPMPATEE